MKLFLKDIETKEWLGRMKRTTPLRNWLTCMLINEQVKVN
jgi:hypothetical protein